MLPTQLAICVATAVLAAISLGLFFSCGTTIAHDIVDIGKSPKTNKPCRFATPSLSKLAVGIGAFGYKRTLIPDERDTYVQSRSALCNADSIEDILLQLYHHSSLAEDIATGNASQSEVVCSNGWQSNSGEDVTSRVARAYAAAIPALLNLDNRLDRNLCRTELSPLSDTSCPKMSLIIHNEFDRQINLIMGAGGYAVNLQHEETEKNIDQTQMLTVLFGLGIYAYWDAGNNGGRCFSNQEKNLDVTKMCELKASNEKIVLMSKPGFPPESTHRCDGTKPNAATAYSTGNLCEQTLTFGYHDQDTLFGIPDASVIANAGETRVSWFALSFRVYSWMYDMWFLEQLTTKSDSQVAMRVFSTFRIGSSLFWVIPGIFVSVFWLGYGGVVAGFYVSAGLWGRATTGIWSSINKPINRPSSSILRWLGLATAVLVAVWTTAIDPYPVVDVPRLDNDCDDYKGLHVYGSSDDLRNAGVTAGILVAAAAAVGFLMDKLLMVTEEESSKTENDDERERLFGLSNSLNPFDKETAVDLRKKMDKAKRSGVVMVLLSLTAVFAEGLSLSSTIKMWLDSSVFKPGEEAMTVTAEAIERDVHILLWTAIGYAASVSLWSQRWVLNDYGELVRRLWAAFITSGLWLGRMVKMSIQGDDLLSSYDEGIRSVGNGLAWGCEVSASLILVLNVLGVLKWKVKFDASKLKELNNDIEDRKRNRYADLIKRMRSKITNKSSGNDRTFFSKFSKRLPKNMQRSARVAPDSAGQAAAGPVAVPERAKEMAEDFFNGDSSNQLKTGAVVPSTTKLGLSGSKKSEDGSFFSNQGGGQYIRP